MRIRIGGDHAVELPRLECAVDRGDAKLVVPDAVEQVGDAGVFA
jgi:hypothetical protein